MVDHQAAVVAEDVEGIVVVEEGAGEEEEVDLPFRITAPHPQLVNLHTSFQKKNRTSKTNFYAGN